MFKNLKSLFVIEDEEAAAAGKATRKEQANSKSATRSTVSASEDNIVSESAAGEPGKITPKFMDILLKAMETQNLDGFDYLEYKQSLRSLEKMPMDEATRYQSAYAMAQTMGATPDKLVKTAQHYVDVLKKEELKFEEALANQQKTQIGSKQGEIGKLEEVIQQKAEQIKQLTKEIEEHQRRSEQLKKEIKQASGKVESTKNNFIASYNALVAQINQDMDRMRKYLK